jgi:CBS domain-containing protein
MNKNVVKVYHDAIATEALEILEIHSGRVLLVTELQRH